MSKKDLRTDGDRQPVGNPPRAEGATGYRAEPEMGGRPSKVYRGSRARIRRLSVWTHTPAGVWILFALALSGVFLILALLATLS